MRERDAPSPPKESDHSCSIDELGGGVQLPSLLRCVERAANVLHESGDAEGGRGSSVLSVG
jgi:hypothetical protein